MAPLWLPPCRIAEQLLNSYKLKTLEGTPLDGIFHARRLRNFIPREGTALAAEQKKLEKMLALEEPNNPQLFNEITNKLRVVLKEQPLY